MACHTKDILDRDLSALLQSTAAPAVILSRVSCTLSDACCTCSSNERITLSNLWSVRQSPASYISNMSTDNIQESATELSRLGDDSTCCIVQDVNIRNRNLPTLQATAQLVASKGVALLHSCSPPSADAGVASSAYLTAAVKTLRSELLVGTPATTEAAIQSTKAAISYLKANAMVCDFGLPCDAPKVAISEQERWKLQACAAVHRELSQDPLHLSDKGTFLPPIIVSLPPFSTVYEEVLMILAAAGADITRVLFNQISLNAAETCRWEILLQRYKCRICVDCWGYSCTFPVTGAAACASFPSDAENVSAVCALCAAGLSANVTLSHVIYCRVQWTQYGGHGYSHLQHIVIPQIRAGLLHQTVGVVSSDTASADSTIVAMTRTNLWQLLNWRPAPVLHEVAVQQLACHICAKLFVPGNHYSKFQFEYCSSACLAVHRRADWK